MINLISNALKFTKNGKIFVVIKDLDENTVTCEIIDNGSGIKKKKYFFIIIVCN